MSRLLQIVDNQLRLDHAALSAAIGQDYDEWRLECIQNTIFLFKLDPSTLEAHRDHPLDEMLIKKLLTINLTAGNHLRVLAKRFFDEPPSKSDINEMRSWLDNVLHHFDAYTLRELLLSCIMDILVIKENSSAPGPHQMWKKCLETTLQRSRRPGVCMYPTCRSLRQSFMCPQCSAQFCCKVHMGLAESKRYHFHQ